MVILTVCPKYVDDLKWDALQSNSSTSPWSSGESGSDMVILFIPKIQTIIKLD